MNDENQNMEMRYIYKGSTKNSRYFNTIMFIELRIKIKLGVNQEKVSLFHQNEIRY